MSMLQTRFDTTTPCEYHDGMPCKPCHEIAQVEAQIENLQSRLKGLSRQHSQARVRRNHVYSPLIHRFPLEIVAEIFIIACRPREYPCHYCEGEPLILGQVCHTWRELAISIPQLWCDLTVDVGKLNLPLLNHQIALSGMFPLSILLGTFSHSFTDPYRTEEAVSFVVKYLHRAASLCLDLPQNITSLSDSIPELDHPKAAPCLKELHIHSDVDSAFRFRIFDSLRPQHLLLKSTSLNQIARDWTNILSLELEECPVGVLLPTLLAATHLKDFHLWLYSESADIPTTPTPEVIPSIEVLNLETVGAGEFMFTMTILPSLRTLDVTGYEIILLFGPLFCDFLRHCALEVLHFDDSSYDDFEDDELTVLVQALIDVLENTNMLRQLRLKSVDKKLYTFDFEPLVRQLSQDRGFLPCLQTLSTNIKFIPRMELLLDVMENRHIPEVVDGPDVVQPLQELKLYSHGLCKITQDNIRRIICLRAAGKKISVTNLERTEKDIVEYWKGFYGLGEQ